MNEPLGDAQTCDPPSPESPEYTHLLSSEKLYRHLVENSLGLICSHDLAGTLLTINAEAARALGYTPNELIGENLRDYLAPEVQHRFPAYLDRIIKNGIAHGDMKLLTRSGQVLTWTYRNTIYAEPGAAPIVIGHAQDVTSRLQIEESLRQTSEQFRRLFEDAPVAYHEIDNHGVVTKVNRAECELLGRSKDELLGTPVWELTVPEQRAHSKEQVRRKLLGIQPLVPVLREYMKSDGHRLTLQIHENLIRSTSGQIIGIRTALLDVTAQLRIDSELRALNAELDRRVTQRTAEVQASNAKLREFIYTVAHDLQEPLRSMSGFVELLKKRFADTLEGDALTFLDYVSSGAARMSGLIADLLSYSRELDDTYEFQELPLNDGVDIAKQNLSGLVESTGARIERANLPVVNANRTRMVQLFQNLLGNAVKYRSEQPPEIQISAERQDRFWIISVADNGIGINAADRERIFGLFKRSQSSGAASGSGVGLSICQAIVQRHGGRIWVDPGAAGGSTFRFTIPAIQKSRAV